MLLEQKTGKKNQRHAFTVYTSYTICKVEQYHLRAYFNGLKMYILSPKSATKVVKQRVIANNQIKEVKWNHKEIIQRRVMAADKGTKNPGDNGKQKARRQGNPNQSSQKI